MLQSPIFSYIKKSLFVFLFIGFQISIISTIVYAKDITLAWDPSPDENIDHYIVYWGTECGNYTQNSPPIKGATSYTVIDLEEENVYYFSAKAVSSSGLESDFSNEAAIPQIESPKETCMVNAENSTGYTLSGTAGAYAAVDILIDRKILTTITAQNDGTWSSTLDFTPLPESLFELYVISTGAHSNVVSGIYDLTVPVSIITEAPETVKGILSSKITIHWKTLDDISDISSTELWFKKGEDGDWENAGLPAQPGPSGTFTYSPTLGEGIYYFTTRSTDGAGNVESEPTGKGEKSLDNRPAAINISIDLSDVIMALQIVSGIDVGEINMAADVNGDGRIGIQEAVYFLKRIILSVPAV